MTNDDDILRVPGKATRIAAGATASEHPAWEVTGKQTLESGRPAAGLATPDMTAPTGTAAAPAISARNAALMNSDLPYLARLRAYNDSQGQNADTGAAAAREKATFGSPLASDAPVPAAPGAPGSQASLELRGSQMGLGNAQQAAPRAAPPPRVAERDANVPVVIKVMAYKDGALVDQASVSGTWDGPLPATYRGTRSGKSWSWTADDPEMEIRHVKDVRFAKAGKKVSGVEEWAKDLGADRVVVFARSSRDVAIDQDEKEDEHAPGTLDKDDVGKGSGGKFDDEETKTGETGKAEGEAAKTGEQGGKEGGTEGATGTGDSNDVAEKEVTEFEESIGIDTSGDSEHNGADTAGSGDTDGGKKPGGKGRPGGDADGRTGEDTELGGTGPGGEQAKRDGDGEGSEDGGTGGSAGGSRAGKESGSEGGMVGGEGKEGDDGVTQGGGSLGLIAVPASLKHLVDIALILSNADFTGFGKKVAKESIEQLAKKGAKRFGRAGTESLEAAVRTQLASAARQEAAKATKQATKKMATDRRTAAAWAKATKEEKAAFLRKVYYEHVDQFYRAAEKAAKQMRKEAQAALKKTPRDAAAKARESAAATMEKAAEVKPVAGRLPQNHALAGKEFPVDQLPTKYRSKGLRFTDEGYPDFEPFAKDLGRGRKTVDIEYTGSRKADFDAANKAAKLDETPDKFTWHHVEGGKKMMLIPTDLHDAVKHTGGVAHYKHATGVGKYD